MVTSWLDWSITIQLPSNKLIIYPFYHWSITIQLPTLCSMVNDSNFHQAASRTERCELRTLQEQWQLAKCAADDQCIQSKPFTSFGWSSSIYIYIYIYIYICICIYIYITYIHTQVISKHLPFRWSKTINGLTYWQLTLLMSCEEDIMTSLSGVIKHGWLENPL